MSSLASLERTKVFALNLILFLILVPNARIFQELLNFLGYPSVTVPMGTAFAGLYVFLGLLAKALIPNIPTISMQSLSRPERLLFFALLFIIGSVLLLHAVFRPIPLPLDNDTTRTFVRLLVGPLTCLLFVGRWHRVRPWPFLMILGTTGVILTLEVVATETSLKISNIVRLVMMGSKEINIVEGLRFRHQLFFGLYSEPSHAFLSLLLCSGGLLVCWRRSLIRTRTLILGIAIFLTSLVVGVSRTGYISMTLGLLLSLFLGSSHLLRRNVLDKLPSKLRRHLPTLTGLAVVALGGVALALALFLAPFRVLQSTGSPIGQIEQDGSLLSGRRLSVFNTVNTLLAGGLKLTNLQALDAATSGRVSQAWIGYSQPVLSPLGSKVGTASEYIRSLHSVPAEKKKQFEYSRLQSSAMVITFLNKLPDTRDEALLAAHRRAIFSIRSYGALLSYYNGVFGWLAVLLLAGGVLHPHCLRIARTETLLISVTAVAMLTVIAFSIPTLPGAWPLLALPGYLAKVHNAGTQALESPLQQGNRHHAPPQTLAPTNLRPTA